MAHTDLTKPHQAVSLSLTADLVVAACKLTDDLSGTVEMLLARYVQEMQQNTDGAELERVLMALNSFHTEHGFLSSEFSTF